MEYTKRDLLMIEFSDTYKDAYGIRPRMNLDHMSLAEIEQLIDETELVAIETIKEQEEIEQYCVEEFERLVKNIIATGANDRKTALRWLRDADEMAGDDHGFFEYNHGLPYGYWKTHCA